MTTAMVKSTTDRYRVVTQRLRVVIWCVVCVSWPIIPARPRWVLLVPGVGRIAREGRPQLAGDSVLWPPAGCSRPRGAARSRRWPCRRGLRQVLGVLKLFFSEAPAVWRSEHPGWLGWVPGLRGHPGWVSGVLGWLLPPDSSLGLDGCGLGGLPPSLAPLNGVPWVCTRYYRA